MQPILEKIPHNTQLSFAIKEENLPYIEIPWHFHPEYELTFFTESNGKRFIGDSIDNFKKNELYFIGKNLPHYMRNDDEYYHGNKHLRVKAIVIHFDEKFLGEQFFKCPEMLLVKLFLQKSSRGLQIKGSTRKLVSQMMEQMLKMEPLDNLLHLLKILQILSRSRETETLSSITYDIRDDEDHNNRTNQIYKYIIENFRNEIHLDKVASKVNMSPSVFCRYFKKRTGKTFSTFLNDLRIGHACKLLIENDLNVTEICYESGFNNISYFNRQFKKIKKQNPLMYRNEFLSQNQS